MYRHNLGRFWSSSNRDPSSRAVTSGSEGRREAEMACWPTLPQEVHHLIHHHCLLRCGGRIRVSHATLQPATRRVVGELGVPGSDCAKQVDAVAPGLRSTYRGIRSTCQQKTAMTRRLRPRRESRVRNETSTAIRLRALNESPTGQTRVARHRQVQRPTRTTIDPRRNRHVTTDIPRGSA
jgi:hypothetical protein